MSFPCCTILFKVIATYFNGNLNRAERNWNELQNNVILEPNYNSIAASMGLVDWLDIFYQKTLNNFGKFSKSDINFSMEWHVIQQLPYK